MKHVIKGFIVHETWNGETQGKFVFQRYPALKDNSSYLQVPICEHELTFEVPDDFDARPAQVASLEKTKQTLRAEFSARVMEIDKQISKLLALEYITAPETLA